MEDKILNIKNTRQKLGWAYADFKWFSDEEAKHAQAERNKLLESLSGKVKYGFLGSKIYTGEISPGCQTCGEGYWSCLFINGLCTSECFFCPQNRKMESEREVYEAVPFSSPDDYVAYLKKMDFRSVGISGGEPLLVFDKLIEYLKAIRKAFGKEFYLWLYTNGDLLDRQKANELKDAGLNEIRFNICARDYELKQVEIAVQIIDTVTIEIPAIPEDYEVLREKLSEMEKVGVKHLNLHQLGASAFNYKELQGRPYTFLHLPEPSIFESEIMALKIIQHAVDHEIQVPINYCSSIYKERFQKKGNRERRGLHVKTDIEEFTEANHLRLLTVKGLPEDIRKEINGLRKQKSVAHLWLPNGAQTEIKIHGSLLQGIDFSRVTLEVSYFSFGVRRDQKDNPSYAKLKIGTDDVVITKECILQHEMKDPITINSFQRLYVERAAESEVLKYFYTHYEVSSDEGWQGLETAAKVLLSFKEVEEIKYGMGDIY